MRNIGKTGFAASTFLVGAVGATTSAHAVGPTMIGSVVLTGRINEQLVVKEGSSTSIRSTSTNSTVDYDPVRRSFTFKNLNGGSFTVTPDEIQASESNAAYTVYLDSVSGLKFKVLALGTANPLIKLAHVSYAYWNQDVTADGQTSAIREDWVVFGRKTPLSGMPKSGSATYAAILDGKYYEKGVASALSGSAGVTANFLAGTVDMFINPVLTNSDTDVSTHLGSMSGTGTISGSNFSGLDSSDAYQFSYSGGFYGPTAQEVGGTVHLSAGQGSGSAVFVGASGALPAKDPGYVSPPPPPPPPATAVTLSAQQVEVVIDRGATGITTRGTSTSSSVIYDEPSGTYIVRELDPAFSYMLEPAEIAADRSDDRYTVYLDAESGVSVKMLNKGSANSLIALNYVSYASWSRSWSTSTGTTNQADFVVFGTKTPKESMPRTGSATYHAILDGIFSSSGNIYALGGDASFTADFGAGNVAFNLHPIATMGSSIADLGNMSGMASISGTTGNTFGGSSHVSGSHYASVSGSFYGPAAEEVGGSFSVFKPMGTVLPGSGMGVFVGKRN